jgi:hypothetical protein
MKNLHRIAYALLYALPLTCAIGAGPGQQLYDYSTLAGTVGTTGSHNATGTSATFDEPIGVAVDLAGNVYVADKLNSLIRVISSGGVVTTLAGSGVQGHHDATGTLATFDQPEGVAVDSMGNVFVADTTNDTIRRITPGGSVSTYAGIALTPGSTNSGTVATLATFTTPSAVAVDSTGNVYVADTGNNIIRKIAPGSGATVGGVVTTFATGFDSPEGITCDSSGNVYVADTFDSVIDIITPAGTVTTLAGTSGSAGTSDGTGPDAQFSLPIGIAVDSTTGDIFVGDTVADTIRKVTQAGVVTTIGGVPGSNGSTNGTGSFALFDAPEGIAAKADGTLFVADADNEVVREGVLLNLAISGDLTSSGSPDVFWTDTSTGERGAYIMNGTAPVSWADFGSIASAWRIAAVADFTATGSNDILWQNSSTGECGFYTMNGATVTGWVELGTVNTAWRIAAVGNFHGTGSNDILWQNTITGECGFYIMNGRTIESWAELGTLPTQWKIAGAADFNGDGKPDILWQNTVTGECGFYIMNGTTPVSWAELGTVPTQWQIAALGDFNGDGKSDILWQNTSTGVAGFYIMNGTTIVSWVGLGQFPLEWQIQPE